jgi:poly(3-hydroxybutyrate) depolymerase
MLDFMPDMNNLYSIMEAGRASMEPFRSQLTLFREWLDSAGNPMKDSQFSTIMKANIEMTERLTRQYKKPRFGITSCEMEGKTKVVKKRTVLKNTFCNLQHFVKVGSTVAQPKLLIVAPMSGHYATLLRGTVQDTLPFFDVYITDWINANQVPITSGSFDLDNFIDYIISYIEFLGPDVHVMAVCQPTVPVLAATAIMSENKDKCVPKSMILIGGPIDARKNPTKPNDFAVDRNLEWFDKAVITSVPSNYPGYRRRVYPGFIQLAGFISMNLQRHITSHVDLYKNLLAEDEAAASKQKKFYDEYLSVMDLPAEFYLQTIKEVFHDFSIARGKFVSRGRKINLDAITGTALMGIEGERDDIAAVGQTKAALNLCKNIPNSKKLYHLQEGVGHYGSFTGSKFKAVIVPKMKEFIYANN